MRVNGMFMLVLAGAAVALPAGLAAQDAVSPGMRVRVVQTSTSAPVVVGELVRIAGDSVIVSAAGGTLVSMSLDEAHRLEVSDGVRRQTTRGVGIGLLAGAVAGAVIGAATYEPCDGWCFVDFGRGGTALISAGALSIPGMIIGGIVGAATTHDTWREVDGPGGLQLRPAAGGGVQFGVSLRFRALTP
jgi:hypothetical protein